MQVRWQRARFLEPTLSPEPFWVLAEAPTQHSFPALNKAGDGFETEKVEGWWYKSNVLAPSGAFFMWAPQHGVELFAEFADDPDPDKRFVRA